MSMTEDDLQNRYQYDIALNKYISKAIDCLFSCLLFFSLYIFILKLEPRRKLDMTTRGIKSLILKLKIVFRGQNGRYYLQRSIYSNSG